MQEIFNLLAAQPADIIQNTLMSEGTVNGNMCEYHNDMDFTTHIYHKILIHYRIFILLASILILCTGSEPLNIQTSWMPNDHVTTQEERYAIEVLKKRIKR
jgi:hypothetical protein